MQKVQWQSEVRTQENHKNILLPQCVHIIEEFITLY